MFIWKIKLLVVSLKGFVAKTNFLAVNNQSLSNSDTELSSVRRRWPTGKYASVEAEGSLLLEAVTGKRLVNTLQAGKTWGML
jgi:hypothetical protein